MNTLLFYEEATGVVVQCSVTHMAADEIPAQAGRGVVAYSGDLEPADIIVVDGEPHEKPLHPEVSVPTTLAVGDSMTFMELPEGSSISLVSGPLVFLDTTTLQSSEAGSAVIQFHNRLYKPRQYTVTVE